MVFQSQSNKNVQNEYLLVRHFVILRSFFVHTISVMNTNDQIRTVIFDVDGTLFDTLPSLVAAANQVMLKAGLLPMPGTVLRPALSEGLRPMFRKAIEMQSMPVCVKVASELENEFMAEYTRHWLPAAPLFARVQETLTALKSQGLRLGICTNRDRTSTAILLASASIAELFDVIVSLEDAPRPKPAADPLLLALERLSMPAADTLFVGDSIMDACCARLCGVRFAAHLGGYAGQAADLLPNVLTFDAYDRLTAWVLDSITTNKDACHV